MAIKDWNIEGIAKVVYEEMIEAEKNGDQIDWNNPDIESYCHDSFWSVASRCGNAEASLVMAMVRETVQEMIDDKLEKEDSNG